jgi:hypothetical protein
VYSIQLQLNINEDLDLHSYHWTINSKGHLSQIALRFKNNGTRTSHLDQVFVNQTRIDETNWATQSKPLYPSLLGWIYIAPQETSFQKGQTYNVSIGMRTGRVFSFNVTASPELISEEKIVLAGAFFCPGEGVHNQGNEVVICAWNNRSAPVIFVRGWCNGVEYDIGRVWIHTGTSDRNLKGDALMIQLMIERKYVEFDLNWEAGRNFTFTLQTAAGNNLTRTYTR